MATTTKTKAEVVCLVAIKTVAVDFSAITKIKTQAEDCSAVTKTRAPVEVFSVALRIKAVEVCLAVVGPRITKMLHPLAMLQSCKKTCCYLLLSIDMLYFLKYL